jgi:Type ISP C-terminal specificity domain/N-6 DNA Methylase
MNEQVILILQAYAARIRELRRANADVAETALAPSFQRLVEVLIPHLPMAPALTVTPEFNQPGVGRPDIALIIPGAPPRAFVELKAPSKSADPERWRQHDRQQYERFRELASWSTCNFHEFRLLERAEQRGQAIIVPEGALRPDRDDKTADKLVAEHNAEGFLRLLERLCISANKEPAAQNASQLATLLAHSSRLVSSIVQDRLAELHEARITGHPLLQVRQEFRDVLYAHPEAGGYGNISFDVLFAGAFAQTLAFGLLLVRESTGVQVNAASWREMPEEHPLMRTALRVLSEDEIVRDIGIGFTVICDTVNSFDPRILAVGRDGRDPILYFYEDYLETFDPDAKEQYGVFYTPVEVVRYMTGALDRALRGLGTEGLRDPAVTILDPATGTGTFLLGIAERVRNAEARAGGAGMGNLALLDLAGRMFGLELLIGPYAVAHYRLHHALSRKVDGDESADDLDLPRLGIYLADTLAEPGAAAVAGRLGYVANGIRDERHEANRIKTEQPILAIIGNPPYRRLEEGENRTLVGQWMDELWRDLKEPVSAAGKGNQLNTFPELSVAFWRWAMWKLFESDNAPRRGVVAMITNRKFLTGWPYAGLRQMMRQRFDRIEIIDLRGDSRRGARAGVEGDQNVFNIQVGVCITLAIADGGKPEGAAAAVRYRDIWDGDIVSRDGKLGFLSDASGEGAVADMVQVERDWLDDFRPKPFENGEWIGLTACFEFASSGIQTKRDEFIYSASRPFLQIKIQQYQTLPDVLAQQLFHSTGAKPWHVAKSHPFEDRALQLTCYRPLDNRWLYNHEAFLDRRRPELQEVWGQSNICLYAMPGGTGAGPAVWCHGMLPDYHSFRGSYGGYAFPLFDRRQVPAAFNIHERLTASLGAAYGSAIGEQDIFDAVLCLLSAESYSLRFAEDLEDVFPHVPFPAQQLVFREAVRLGREIRFVETFSRAPAARYLSDAVCRIADQPRGNIAAVNYIDGGFILCDDGTGRVTGVPQVIWDFAVSGYALLPRWLNGRVGLRADFALVREMRDICGRIGELIDLFGEADRVLAATLEETLSRAALGIAQAE